MSTPPSAPPAEQDDDQPGSENIFQEYISIVNQVCHYRSTPTKERLSPNDQRIISSLSDHFAFGKTNHSKHKPFHWITCKLFGKYRQLTEQQYRLADLQNRYCNSSVEESQFLNLSFSTAYELIERRRNDERQKFMLGIGVSLASFCGALGYWSKRPVWYNTSFFLGVGSTAMCLIWYIYRYNSYQDRYAEKCLRQQVKYIRRSA